MAEVADRRGVFRICLTGPESTGKSELAHRLAWEYDTVWVPEFARDYALRAGRELSFADVDPIARGQIENEERVTPRASRLLLLDTDLISTVVYSRHYYGRCPAWVEDEARRRRSDFYLLMNVDVPWLADPARDAEHQRDDLFMKFHGALEELGAKFEIVRGAWDERLRRARELIRPYAAR